MLANNQILYHYTSQANLQNIIKSKQLWMREASVLNDTTEIVHFTEHLNSLLSSREYQVPEARLKVTFFLQSITPKLYGIASFSSEGDYLNMWRLYGDNTKGCAIGFKSEGLRRTQKSTLSPRAMVLRTINDVMLKPVQYEDFPGKVMLDACLEATPPPKGVISTAFEKIRWKLMEAACSMKKTSYREEKEVRLIKHFRDYYQADHSIYELGFLEQHYHQDENGYLIYKHDFLPEQIDEVILGCNCPMKEDEVYDLLAACGYPQTIAVKRSIHSHRI